MRVRRLNCSGNLLLQNTVHSIEDRALGQTGRRAATFATIVHPARTNRCQNIVNILLHLAGAGFTTRGSSSHLFLRHRVLRNCSLSAELNATAHRRAAGSHQGSHLSLLDLYVAFTAFAYSRKAHIRRITLARLLRNGFLLLQTLLGLHRQVIFQGLQQRQILILAVIPEGR